MSDSTDITGRKDTRDRELLKRILPYIPPYWVRQAFADPDRTLVGREGRIYAAVLYVDISGFTPISESLSRKGREGVEELSAILERYFTVMAEPVFALGGEVVKFAGDSLVVLFPAQLDGEDAHLGAALHCSLRMQRAMSQFAQVRTSAGTFPLMMKIGIGEGAIYNTTVGDEVKGMQPVSAGRPIARCIQAEDMASAGEIVADAALVNRTPGRLDVGEARGTFRLIAGATDMPVLPPIQQVDVSAIDPERAALLVRRLSPYLPAQLLERIRQGQRGVYGEYRRVTIMFVKFGGLNFDWDPSVGYVLQVYFAAMRDCILRYGGRLNEVDIVADGGTLVVFFGAPTAHEDDELRAISCAWEMQQAVVDVRAGAGTAAERLRQCIGISSNPVFVGDVGAPTRRTYTAVGDEVNLTSRLMDLARWGEIVVSSWVQKRVLSRFEFEAMGEVRLRGKAEPVPVFSLISPRRESMGGGPLSQIRDRRSLVDLVGRTSELAALSEVCDRAWRGKPQLLLITGAAGMGKSRLVGELMREWAERGGHAYVGDCRRRGSDVPYRPWDALIRAALGLQKTGSPNRQREQIEAQLTSLSPLLARQAGLFCDLLQVEIAPDSLSLASYAKAWSSHSHELLKDFFEILAQRRPLLLVLEDLQDIDDASLLLLNDLLRGLPGLPFLICATCRPTDDLYLAEHVVSTTRLELDELSESESLAIAQRMLEEAELPFNLAPYVVEQAQGNPLYLQETVRALADFAPSEALDAATALAQGRVISERVSDTIQALVDHLDEDYKLTLRIAAVIGRQFGFEVLQAAHPMAISRHSLIARLSTLERMHLIQGRHPSERGQDSKDGEGALYRFRYLMTQRVIYDSLLTADRERFHRHVGQALETVYVDDPEPQVELLIDHFYRGNMLPKAVGYLMLAGHRAFESSVDPEALAHYGLAERILSECDACQERCVQGVRLSLHLSRGHVYYRMLRVSEASHDYERAFALAGSLTDLKTQGEALLCLGGIALFQARYTEADALIRHAMQSFSALNDRDAMARALLLISKIYALRGRFRDASRYVERAMSFGDGSQSDTSVARCRCRQGEIYYWTGRLSQASEALNRSVELGNRAGEQGIALESTLGLARLSLCRGRWGQALRLSREGVQVSRRLGSRLIVADAQRVLALVLVHIGAHEEASNLLDNALSIFAGVDGRVGLASCFWIAGEALLVSGRYEQAAERFHRALRLGRETNTVDAVIRAQLGLSKLAAVNRNWSEKQRLCTEVRARARQANLELAVVAARQGLARAYLGHGDWRRARHEASQAHDMSYRLRCPYEIFRAAATLGEALMGLGQAKRAQQHVREARDMIRRLADTLPQHYAQTFLNRPYVRIVCDRAAGYSVDEGV